MSDNPMWCGDVEGYTDEMPMDHGTHWVSDGGDATYENVRRPIGFMRRKPVVRVKAWMQPIVEVD